MNRQKAAFPRLLLAAIAVLAAVALMAPAIASAEEVAAPTATIHYTKETQQAYEHQLDSGEIEAATFNKRIRSLHIKTKNGEYFLYHYPAHDEPKLASQLEHKGIAITVLKKTEAEKEAKSGTVHHKLRYIAGGVLIVIIIIVVGVLFWDRKRKMAAE
jgi:ATP-dependent Zn protease